MTPRVESFSPTPGNLCASKQKARVSLIGHNGRKNQGNTVLQTSCKKHKRKSKRHGRHSRRG